MFNRLKIKRLTLILNFLKSCILVISSVNLFTAFTLNEYSRIRYNNRGS